MTYIIFIHWIRKTYLHECGPTAAYFFKVLTAVASKALVVVERLNFTITSFFNVVLLGSVKQMFELSEWIKNTRGMHLPLLTTMFLERNHPLVCMRVGACAGHIHFTYLRIATLYTVNKRNTVTPRYIWKWFIDIGLGMVSSLQAFLVYHAAVGHKILPEHFNWHPSSSKEDFFVAEDKQDAQMQLVKLFSHDGDWVLDMNCFKGIYHPWRSLTFTWLYDSLLNYCNINAG